MTRSDALVELGRLGRGLDASDEGVGRLRERLTTHPEPEALKDLLIELGVLALLQELE